MTYDTVYRTSLGISVRLYVYCMQVVHRCDQCGKNYSDGKALKAHIQSIHKRYHSIFIQCTAQSTIQYSLYTAHCMLHNTHCTLDTAHFSLHTAYCTLHTNNAPCRSAELHCSQCERIFSSKYALNRHRNEVRHSYDVTYVCPNNMLLAESDPSHFQSIGPLGRCFL